jgi:uncharacterized protein (TIGR03435 family)
MIRKACMVGLLSCGTAFGQTGAGPVIGKPLTSGIVGRPSLHDQLLHPAGPLPSYEVATIKPYAPGGPVGYTIRTYIGWAFGVPFGSSGRLIGGPDWINKQQYVIDGKIPNEIRDEMQQMTPEARSREQGLLYQSLLADRCKLKVHFETRELPVYELVIAKGGSKMKEVPLSDDHQVGVSMSKARLLELKGKSAAMSDIVQMLPHDRPIIDETGLTGRYDLLMDWSPEQSASAPGPGTDATASEPSGSSIFTALQEQLGLKLVPAKGSVEVVFIDSIETPSEN